VEKPQIPILENDSVRVLARFQGEAVAIQIVGKITEELNLKKLYDELIRAKVKEVAFDLQSVTQINSCGVREWILFIERAQSTMSSRFFALGEAFIEQVNFVPRLLGKAGTAVATFDVPYFCSTCNERVIKTVAASQMQISGQSVKPPANVCAKCKKPMELDALEDEYFTFLKYSLGLSTKAAK
jgi:anti-anti-sigma regulatory factor